MTTPILLLPEWSPSQAQPHVPVNEALRGLEAVAQITILSIGENTPPSGPVNGDRHIVGSAPLGFWTGKANQLAVYNNGWKFLVPRRGWLATHEGTGVRYEYGGTAWGVLAISGGGGSSSGTGGYKTSLSPDIENASPSAFDDEFDSGTVIDTTGARRAGANAWSWRNQGTSNANLRNGALVLAGQRSGSTGAQALRIVEQTISGAAFVIRGKIGTQLPRSNFTKGGLALVNSANGKVMTFGPSYENGQNFLVAKWNSVSSYNSALFNNSLSNQYSSAEFQYYEIELAAGTLHFRLSATGNDGTFETLASEAVATFIGAVDRVGVFSDIELASGGGATIVDWFRRYDTGYTPALAMSPPVSAETHPQTPDAADDEFEFGSSIDTSGTRRTGATAWAWRNQGAATESISKGNLVLTAPAVAGDNLRIVEQVAPTAPWRYVARLCSLVIGNFNAAGLVLVNNANGRLIAFGGVHDTFGKLSIPRFTNVTTFLSNILAPTDFATVLGTPATSIYFAIASDGTTLTFSVSPSGADGTFRTLATESIANHIASVDRIGFYSNAANATFGSVLAADFFRRTA